MSATSKFDHFIALLSLIGIAGYLVLRYVLDSGQEIYTVAFSTSISSTVERLYAGQFSYSLSLVQLPLIAVLILGGLPLVY
ncbi:MAG: heavy metal translocating P-type ATPase, partial [Methylosarcina sp.]